MFIRCFYRFLWLAGEGNRDVTEYISHTLKRIMAAFLSVCNAYIYFHVMIDVYLQELLKSTIPLLVV